MRKAARICAAALTLVAASAAQATILIPSTTTSAATSSLDISTGSTTTYFFSTQWSVDTISGKIDLCYTMVTKSGVAGAAGTVSGPTTPTCVQEATFTNPTASLIVTTYGEGFKITNPATGLTGICVVLLPSEVTAAPTSLPVKCMGLAPKLP